MGASKDQEPDLSVLIANFNGRELLGDCLEGLRTQDWPADRFETIVVDNGSTDGSADWLRATHPDVRVLAQAKNLGFAEANNRAAAAARGQHLVLLNNDARPSPAFLGALVEAAGGGAAAVAGRIRNWPGDAVEFGGADMNCFGFGFQRSSWHADFAELAPGAEIPFACGGAMLVKRDVFLDLGGFDPDYFVYYEDVDFGWRLWLSGHRIVYAPAAEVRHHRHATGRSFSDRWRHFHYYKNVVQTLMKNSEAGFVDRLLPVALVLFFSRVGSFYDLAVQARERGDLPAAERHLDVATGTAEGLAWVLARMDLVAEKRSRVQARRRVSDRVLSEKFGLRLDFGPEVQDWPENLRALQLLQLVDVARLLQPGQLEDATAARLRELRGEVETGRVALLERLKTDNERLRHEVAALRGSWSWRLMAPLRLLDTALGKLAGRL